MTDDPMHARFRAELRRSILDTPVGRWMLTHRGELAKLLHEKVDWGLVARHMAEHGLCDPSGRPPAAHTIRLTWTAIAGAEAQGATASNSRARRRTVAAPPGDATPGGAG